MEVRYIEVSLVKLVGISNRFLAHTRPLPHCSLTLLSYTVIVNVSILIGLLRKVRLY